MLTGRKSIQRHVFLIHDFQFQKPNSKMLSFWTVGTVDIEKLSENSYFLFLSEKPQSIQMDTILTPYSQFPKPNSKKFPFWTVGTVDIEKLTEDAEELKKDIGFQCICLLDTAKNFVRT